MGLTRTAWLSSHSFLEGLATGVAVALIAAYQPVHPNAGIAHGLTAFVIVALGGFGSIGVLLWRLYWWV